MTRSCVGATGWLGRRARPGARVEATTVVLAMVGVLALLGSGCGGGDEGDGGASRPSSRADDTGGATPAILRTAEKRDPNTLDPALMWDTYDGQVGALVHQGLVRFGEGTDIVPALATAWTIAEDGLSATFTLRDEARFHDGTPVSAWDVKYSVLRVLDPAVASQRRWIYEPYLRGHDGVPRGAAAAFVEAWGPVRRAWMDAGAPEDFAQTSVGGGADAAEEEAGGGRDANGATARDLLPGVVVEGPRRVTFRFDRAYLPFLTMLAMPNAAVIPLGAVEEAAARGGAPFGQRPIGAGPWTLTRWTAGERLDFAPFDDYWGGRAMADGLVWRVIGETSTWRAEFEARNLDFYLVSANDYREWRARPDRRALMVPVPELNVYFLGFNTAKPPFDDARVRRALALAVNRAEMLEYVALGRGTLAAGPVPPEIARADAAAPLPPIDFDPEAARRLLAEAGIAPPPITILLTNDRHNMALMEAVKSYWEAIGARVTLRALDRAATTEARRRGEHDVYFSNWWADYPDVDNFLFPLFHSANVGGSNGTGFADAEVDRLLDAARFEASPARRMELFAAAERRVVEAMPMVFLWHRSSTMAVAPDITGYRPHPMLNGVDFHVVGRRAAP